MTSIHALTATAVLLSASTLLSAQPLEPDFGATAIASDSPGPSAYGDYGEAMPVAPGEAMIVEPPSDGEPLAPGEYFVTDPACEVERVPRYRSRVGLEFTFVDVEISDGDATYWTSEPTTVSRGEFALENACGYGARAQIWSLDKEFELEDDRMEARVASYYVDGYRRFVGRDGELLLGGGLAIGSLKIDSPYVDPVRRFSGVGGSLVGEGFYPFARFEKTDIGVTGRARLAVLGPVEDNFEDEQAMLLDELGVGLELRRRFGKCEDKMWFVRVGYESQHWSDVDAPFSIDQRLEGASFAFGFAW